MKRSKEELLNNFAKLTENDTRDEVLNFLEDLADSLEDVDKTEIEQLKAENDDLRRKYKERFFNASTDDVIANNENVEDITINDLFVKEN